MKTTCNTGYRIDENWDSNGEITAESNPEEQYNIWHKYASLPDNDWNGDEFSLSDFEKYIEQLKENEVSK